MPISPTAEGFRAAFRRPLFTVGEIIWRWSVGAFATALFFFGLFQYLNTLPVTSGELLLLRSRQPYLVARAMAHILRGSLNRAVMSAIVAAILLAVIWILAASLGRIAILGALLNYFREKFRGQDGASAETGVADDRSSNNWRTMLQLNFLRTAVVLGSLIGFVGALIVAGFASPAAHPRPGVVFLLFLPLAGLISLVWWALNWLLSLAAVFAVRNGEAAVEAISSAVSLCRERLGALVAVSTWTGLAHVVVFSGATTAVAVPLSLAGLLPWRLVLLGVMIPTLGYLAIADWIYMARLAGYVCIAELPEALLNTPPPSPAPGNIPPQAQPLKTTIDRDEPILSDVPGLIAQT